MLFENVIEKRKSSVRAEVFTISDFLNDDTNDVT